MYGDVDEDERDERARNEHHLAATARVLYERGDHKTAALLLDTAGLVYRWIKNVVNEDGEYEDGWDARIECEPWVLTRKSHEDQDAILWALRHAALRDDMTPIVRLSLIPIDNDAEWRSRLNTAMAEEVPMTNAGRIYPLDSVHPREDRMSFRSVAELRVYQALKRARSRRDPHRTIGILALPMMSVPSATWEPDLVVTVSGRVGVIEVDGPSHRGMDKRSSERSRDRLLAGVSPLAWS